MKTTLLAAIAVLALTTTSPAFADEAHRDSGAAGARGTWRTNETDGAVAKQYQAALDPHDTGRVAPRVALSDSTAIA